MKKLISLIFALLFISVLPSCEKTFDSTDKLRVVTTIFPQYDFARAISAGTPDSVELTMLLPPGSESHDYEPSLADLALIESSDLFICVGGETDAWVDSAIKAVGGKVNVLRLTDLVPLLPESEDGILEYDHHDHDHSTGEECHEDHTSFDEHVWTSPANAASITAAICDAMSRARPDLADSFKRASEEYIAKLLDLDARFEELSNNSATKTLFFADRFPFRYFTERYSLSLLAAFSGCSSDSEPTLATIYSLSERAIAENARVILVGEFSSGNAANVIADRCSAEIRELHSCHNVSKKDFDSGVTYADLMEKNLASLKDALN